MWRNIRIAILLLILGIAAWSNWYDRLSTTDWDDTLSIGVFPVDDAGNPVVADYVARLTNGDVADIEHFLDREAKRYGIGIARPVSATAAEDIRPDRRACPSSSATPRNAENN